jgi:hypothetical protein
MEYKVEVFWECPENEDHKNTMFFTLDVDNDDEVEDVIENLVQDVMIQKENPCVQCESIGFCEVDWKHNKV